MSKNNIEAIYPLSPMQEGILFHSLYSPDSDIYIGQISYSLYGDLNHSAFERAWRKVTERHAVLRTFFVWEQRERPLQIVRPAVDFQIERQDWRGLERESRQRQLDLYLTTDREVGLDLSKAPLMRGSLIRLEDRRFEFIWTNHRLIIDGWSVALLMKEVFLYYKAYGRGEELELESARPYRDFIVWLQKQDKAKAERYWRKLLSGITSPTRLGMHRDGANTEKRSEDFRGETAVIGRETLGKLQEVARKRRLTMSTILQGAWAVLLSEYSGDRDVVFGVTVSGRPAEIEGIEYMMGAFINTLPLRVKIEGKKSVVEWLNELQQEQAEAREYQYSPLVEIQGWSNVPRGAPLFESILVYENYPVSKESGLRGHEDEEQTIRVARLRSFERSNYALALMASAETELLIEILYDRQRINAEAISRLISHLKQLLGSLAANPDGPVSALEILPDAERRQLLVAWNSTEVCYESNLSIQELFERNVGSRPDAIAVMCKGDQLSYGELNRKANRLAHSLRTKGLGPESLVGVLMERGMDLVVGLLGILKAGGAYVPIDPAYPDHRIRLMIEDANLNHILAQKRLAERLSEQNVCVIYVDADLMETEQVSEENPANRTLADNLAYVNYTSGSTGKAKGVRVSHKNVLRLVRGAKYARMDAEQVFLHFAPICFDAATFEIWGCLLNGGSLTVVPSDASALDDVGEAISRHGVTILWLTSGLFNLFVDERVEDLMSVKQLLAGGDVLSAAHVSKAMGQLKGTEFINGYGPTEATTFTCCYKVESDDQLHNGVPIGRPISNTRVYLLNGSLKPAPIGITGELYIGGDGLALGYHNRPDLTAELFIPAPFSHEPSARLYRTGDIARYREDGNIEFIGRRDRQVKVRGYRIELGEIETALREQEEVKDAVVAVRGEDAADKRLVGYVVWKEGRRVSRKRLVEKLRERLPDYMTPGDVVELESLPLTSNGKIDRERLPEPVRLFEEASFKERSPLQELLTGIWADVLGAQKIEPDDNFFDLGGHSLLASRVVSQIRKKLKVALPLRHIFEFPTITELAEKIQLEMGLLSKADLTPIRRAQRTGDLPLSFAQQRLWFLDQLSPGDPAYNINQAFRLSGSPDLPALESAFSYLLSRHETLRSYFPLKNGQPVQLISPPRPVKLEVEDLIHLDPHLREQEAHRRLKQEAARSFDLINGPVFRVGLLRLTPSDHILHIGMHHIISDGWSVGVLMEELGRLYEGGIRGEKVELRELDIQYVDYAVWQREKVRGDELERELEYWKMELEGAAHELEIGARKRGGATGNHGAIQIEMIGEALSEEVKRMSREEGVTLFMALFAAFNVVLSYRSGCEDILVGVDVADRNREELEGLIGLLVNQLVLRTDLSGDPTFLQLLERVREVTLRAYAHQDLPFDKLVNALNPARGSNRNPLFQVMFGFQNLPKNIWRLPGLDLTPLAMKTDTAIFDLSLYMADSQNGLVGVIRHNTDLFDCETVTGIFRQLESVLSRVVGQREIRISHLRAFLAEQEKQGQAAKQTNFTQAALRRLKGIKPSPVNTRESQ